MKVDTNQALALTFEQIHTEATAAATAAATRFLKERMGGRDSYPCGFVWVTVDVAGNTRLGRKMKELKFKKPAVGRGLQLWNPSGLPVQNMDAKFHGAVAYASVLAKYGIEAIAEDRLD